jgi:hypothetical protein
VTAVAANYGRDGLALLGWLFCGLAFALSSTLFALRRR